MAQKAISIPNKRFIPEVSGVYYISASAYTGNPFVDNMRRLHGYGNGDGARLCQITGPMSGDDIPMDNPKGTTNSSAPMKGEKISGLGGNDSLYAMAGDDTLDGGEGDDLLVGGPGADTLMGGAGDNDTISYAHSEAGVTINLADGTAQGGNADGDTIVDMGDGDRDRERYRFRTR